MVQASSYARREIQAAFHGSDTACFLKSTLSELFFGNGNIDIWTRMRSDNPIVVEHAHSINSVTKERRLSGFPESDRDEMRNNAWLGLSRVMSILNIPDEMAETTTQNKSILLLSRNISQTIGGWKKNAISKTYQSDNQYLSFPATKDGRGYPNTFARKRARGDSWQTPGRGVIFLINCVTRDQKRIMEGIRNF